MSIMVRRPLPIPLAVIALLLSAAPVVAQTVEGLFVTVPNPITSDAVDRIKNQIKSRVNAQAHRAETIVFDFNPDGKPAATISPGVCSDLTAFIRGLHNVNTVAFVHHKVSGHTVMPVLACKEIVMSKDGAIGEIAGENIDPERGEYRGSFEKDPRGFQLIRKMYDRDVKLRKAFVRANPAQKTFIDERDAEMVKLTGGHEEVQGVQDFQLALYNAQVARRIGLSAGMAETRAEVAERYGLSPSAIRDDPLQGRTPDVYRWVLKDNVDGKMRESINRVIRDVRKKGGNVLILVISCDGHDLVTVRGIADDLIKAQSGDDAIQIIAFIPESCAERRGGDRARLHRDRDAQESGGCRGA